MEKKNLKNWWKTAVFYQIYPRSFYDANNDGIGDLKGIVSKLDYLRDKNGGGLGIDAIWISPFFKSPMKDFGYDISDYCAIDPMFGTMEDFDEMLAAMHDRDIKLLIDLVLNHTSDQHPWFIESAKSRNSPKADWYVWRDAKPDGSEPNNWLNVFSGKAWTWNENRKQYYMHSFLKEQPDLNWYNPEVQEAIKDVIRFWLKKGVDGFRLDTANFYAFDRELRDNPKRDPSKGLVEKKNVGFSAYDAIYSKDRPENAEFLKIIRACMEEFDNEYTSIGEIGGIHNLEDLIKVCCEAAHGDEKLHMAYNFSLLSDDFSAEYLLKVLTLSEQHVEDGWVCWSLGNHDCVRLISRVANQNRVFADSLLMLLLSIKGSPVLYYGDELNMPQAEIGKEDMQDPFGILNYPEPVGRDGCRTPFLWDSNQKNFGFNAGKKSWLPFGGSLSLNEAQGKSKSTLEFIKEFLAFRKNSRVLQLGSYTQIEVQEQSLTFVRELEGEKIFFALNTSEKENSLKLPAEGKLCEFKNYAGASKLNGVSLVVGAYSSAIIEL